MVFWGYERIMILCRKQLRRLAIAAGLGCVCTAALAQNAGAPGGLVSLYADALNGNAAYQAALAQFRAAAELEPLATGKLLPQVGVRGTYDYVHEEVEGTYYGIFDIDREDDFPNALIGAQLTQALYRPELWIERDQAKKKVTQARFALDQAEDQLMIGVTAAYFAVLAAQDNKQLTDAERDAVTRQLDQVQGRYASGMATDADLQAAKAQRALIDAKALEAGLLLEAAFAGLEVAVGHPVRQLKVLPDEVALAPPDPARVQDWEARAKEQNLRVLSLRLGSEIAVQEVEKANKLRWPKIDLTGRGLYLDSGGGLSGDRTELEGRVGVGVNVPIYSGGQISAAIRAAEQGSEASKALINQAQADAVRDVRVSFQQCQIGTSRIPALKTAVDAARAAEQANQAGYEVGTQTSADVLRAVEARYSAERDYAGARYKFMLDTLQLKYAAGNLANTDLVRFDRLLRAPSPSGAP
jgi:outer membrane protein